MRGLLVSLCVDLHRNSRCMMHILLFSFNVISVGVSSVPCFRGPGHARPDSNVCFHGFSDTFVPCKTGSTSYLFSWRVPIADCAAYIFHWTCFVFVRTNELLYYLISWLNYIPPIPDSLRTLPFPIR